MSRKKIGILLAVISLLSGAAQLHAEEEEVIWEGPGWYDGVWIENEVEFNEWHGNNEWHDHYDHDEHEEEHHEENRGGGGYHGGGGGGHR